jgi:cytidylate kinase
MKKFTSVAIDGPSGAGKSTVAKSIAKKLQYLYLDTGAMYRTVGLAAEKKGVPHKDEERLRSLLQDTKIELQYTQQGQKMLLNGEDVSQKIRTPEISIAASDVSTVPFVREYLLGMQRNIARNNNVIMDGRDIGTVVLPDADVKIFLTASPEARTKRRLQELLEKGVKTDYNTVYKDIQARDNQDLHRASAPLRMADDAVLLDTTEMSLQESIEAALQIIMEKLGRKRE